VRQRREQSAEIGVRVARGGVVEVDDGQMTVAEQLVAGDPGLAEPEPHVDVTSTRGESSR
jgi:hypothetical protein